jgi:flagellar biosynthetic protein FliP
MNCRLVQMASIVTVLLLTLVGSGGGVAHGDEPVLMPLESGQPESSPRQHQDGHAPSSRQVSEPGLLHSVNDLPPTSGGRSLVEMLEGMLPESGLAGPLSAAVTIGVVSLAPAALLMTTCFVRFSVVLSLVRQGLGTQGMPSNQIVASLALFLSAVVMWPVWSQAWTAGVEPYQAGELALPAALDEGSLPVRRWMAGQIEAAGNRETVLMFLQRHPSAESGVATYDDVPVEALLPAFLVSELETAFKLGVRLLIPFLLIDLVVATLVVSSGLVMLPPTIVSFPLKILVFVMADGWTLVVTSLLNGVSPAVS